MFTSLRKIVTTLGVSLAVVFVPVLAPVAVYAASTNPDIQGKLRCGTELNIDGSGCTGGATSTDTIQNVVTTIINLFSVIVGIVAVIMIIYGGFKYTTSAGESSKMTSGRTTIVYALVGLIVVALAQFIVQFVLSRVIPA